MRQEFIRFRKARLKVDEKCIQKQIIKLCHNYSKQTGSEFKNYHDPDFLKWLEKINPTEPDKNKRVYTYIETNKFAQAIMDCLLYTSPSPRDRTRSRMPSSA